MKFRFLSLPLVTALALVFGLLSLSAKAASPDSILVNIAPENPAPLENTNITLSSYASNLDTVLITWFVNGKNMLSGVGEKSFSLNAPAAGSIATVIARIALPDGEIEKRITIKPNVMVLLWQASDSYVPPFYRGKALPTPDSEIKVVAMPEIKGVSGADLTYVWKKDYTNNIEGSGYGKNFFIYINDYLDDSNNISVTAETTDQNSSSQASIDIGMTQPKINFYKKDSTTGILWDRALADTHRIQDSEVIVAIPYFISPKELQHPRLVWNWFINDNPIQILGFRKNIMPIQAQGGTSGVSRLKLQIENLDKIFQTTSKEISVEF